LILSGGWFVVLVACGGFGGGFDLLGWAVVVVVVAVVSGYVDFVFVYFFVLF